MGVTLSRLAELVQGDLHGAGDLLIESARPLGQAEPGSITFLEDPRQARLLAGCQAAAAVVPPAITPNHLPLIRVADPLAAFLTIFRRLHGRPAPAAAGIHPKAHVHDSASLGPDARLDPFASVGEGSQLGARCRLHAGVVVGRYCQLGDDVTLFPNVVLYDGTRIGNRVTIHANAVLGADGFGYRQQQGRHVKVPQLGHVEIGDDVEIGAGTTIDRGTFQATQVGAGSKIDNLVQIGHNCRIGRHNLIISQVGIGGSSTTGDYVVLAGQAGVSDHINIGAGTQVGAKSGVTKDLEPGARVYGYPCNPAQLQLRILALLKRLPELVHDVQAIKKRLSP